MKKIIAGVLLALLLLVLPGFAAPTVVDSCAITNSGISSSSVSCNLDSNTGSNLLFIAGVFGGNAATIDTVTHNGDSATPISATVECTACPSRLRVFYRTAPDAGSGLTATANISGNQPLMLIAVIIKDVNQTTPYENESTFDPESSSASGTQNVTSAAGDLVIDFFIIGNSTLADNQSVTPGANQTMLETNVDILDNYRAFSSTEAGAATVTMSHSWTPNNMQRLARAYNIKAGPNAAPLIFFRRRR